MRESDQVDCPDVSARAPWNVSGVPFRGLVIFLRKIVRSLPKLLKSEGRGLFQALVPDLSESVMRFIGSMAQNAQSRLTSRAIQCVSARRS